MAEIENVSWCGAECIEHASRRCAHALLWCKKRRGIQISLQRDASERHQEIMRTLVEITWHTFAANPPSTDRDGHEGREGEADVIRLAQEVRRPRR